MSPRVAVAIAAISIMLSLVGMIYVQHQMLAAAKVKVTGLEERMAYAEATISLLEARATTDAKIERMTPSEVREGLKKWTR
ncbi:hypothetical protein [Devosia sp. SD17-2]|uniref:hypothetical protein n=1 Tax=Devosia sp. SD17-2 TaxID=2976459 RepID=UPI0023D801A7|nr:hypothetical protein [Devosia sp. SD17-2]WEJ31712.1 hypothetical protein NYQ88_12435 [Devosia sp. SD17-2]